MSKARVMGVCAVSLAVGCTAWFLLISRTTFWLAGAAWTPDVAFWFALAGCVVSVLGFISGAAIGHDIHDELEREEAAKKERKA